jgi:Putative metallopeptidase
VFDIYDIPVFGREEDAADQFATYMMLQFGEDRAHRLILGAAFSYRMFVKNFKQKPNVTVPLLAFSSDHGAPEQRFYNLLCLAYGYDAKLFADLVANEALPKRRAENCRFEYAAVRYAYKQLIVPHLDMDLAAKVMDAKWLDDADHRPVALRGDESRRRR